MKQTDENRKCNLNNCTDCDDICNEQTPEDILGTWQSNQEKTFYFLKGYALAMKFRDMQKSLIIAKKLHKGQMRASGAEYLVHPLRVCCYLIALGFNDDVLLSAALLHDTVEDVAEIRDNPKKLISEYGLSQEVLDVVLCVTKNKGVSMEAYYAGIQKDWRALIIKLSDRCNNVSTLQSFAVGKMVRYIEETKNFVLPLCKYGKLHYPEYSNEITVMKYHITSLSSMISAMILQNGLLQPAT